MTIPTRCPQCSTVFRVAQDSVGRWARCNHCGAPFQVALHNPAKGSSVRPLPAPGPAPARGPSHVTVLPGAAPPLPPPPPFDYSPAVRDEPRPPSRRVRVVPRKPRSNVWMWVGGAVTVGLVCCGGFGGLIVALAFQRAPETSRPATAAAAAASGPAVRGDKARGEDNNRPVPSEPAPPPPRSAAKGLEQLKAATVFIKVDAGAAFKGSGSGFVIRADGNTAYVVTNDHVASPEEARAGRRGNPRIAVNVVFRSGTRNERSAPAEVLASDPEIDLAVLRVSNVPDLPRPIDVASAVDLQETLPVTVYGFPFGSALATNHGNPAITVNKGSVSSIRRDERDRVVAVQIDGALNPGNSGGPVVDDDGRLVGVAVATIKGTHIGLAVPGTEVTRILEGRAGNAGVRSRGQSGGSAELEVQVPVFDPFNHVRAVAVHFLPSGAADVRASGAGSEWTELPGSQWLDLQLSGALASGSVTVAAADARRPVTFQTSWVDRAGRRHFNAPVDLSPPTPGSGTVVRVAPLQQQMESPQPGRRPGSRPRGRPPTAPRAGE